LQHSRRHCRKQQDLAAIPLDQGNRVTVEAGEHASAKASTVEGDDAVGEVASGRHGRDAMVDRGSVGHDRGAVEEPPYGGQNAAG
jgi:hypothetical protein